MSTEYSHSHTHNYHTLIVILPGAEEVLLSLEAAVVLSKSMWSISFIGRSRYPLSRYWPSRYPLSCYWSSRYPLQVAIHSKLLSTPSRYPLSRYWLSRYWLKMYLTVGHICVVSVPSDHPKSPLWRLLLKWLRKDSDRNVCRLGAWGMWWSSTWCRWRKSPTTQHEGKLSFENG